MGNELASSIKVSELAKELKLDWDGPDLIIRRIDSLQSLKEGSLSFSKKIQPTPQLYKSILISPPGTEIGNGSIIQANNPRLVFAKALVLLSQLVGFKKFQEKPQIGNDAIISSSAFLGKGVVVGDRSLIGHNVVIHDGVNIGKDCVIKSNTIIGEAGFGFERDEMNKPIRLLHLGGVIIGNRVELGSLNSVCRGTIENTIIQDDVKTDDQVHIAHNCIIRKGALISACVEISGGVDVGEYSWIGPNSSVVQKIKIGKKSFVGIASNVTKSVNDGVSVAGNPAKVIKKIN